MTQVACKQCNGEGHFYSEENYYSACIPCKGTGRVETEIIVGMGASGTYWTDYYPFEVIKISPSGKTITIRRMDAEPAEGHDYFGNQQYTYTPNPDGATHTVRFTKQGYKTPEGMRIYFGRARRYEDPSF